ncbi:TetR/AcrR family transcriptional regulator [Streptomyces griseus]|uniref:TetR/AcrR family transcriptional regulator n=1 Tax=Streptomyces griseus TaxID=1911 RepID=UPI00089CD9B6|nr:TetR/AcrR family transcriptional regulator [Streptomyces griseus]SEE58176.1 DNA-binding transcriptional regulator, AcrR family [Streptomyces griseus]SQA26097.1 Transcriptional regulator [Streptomyces griseus]
MASEGVEGAEGAGVSGSSGGPGGVDGGEPGTVRPGGRTARVREAVLRAAGDALVEHGFDGLDLADVARRAEVGKTTVYRRWSAPAGLVADLLSDMAEQSLPRADTGSLAEDLRANARLVVRTLADPRQGALFAAVIAAATCDPRTADALHRFYAVRIAEWSGCVEAAVGRGELPAGTDPGEVIAAVSAPLYYRLLASGAPLDEAAADRAAAAAVAAAREGVYVR